MKTIRWIGLWVGAVVGMAAQCYGQTNLVFTSATATDEGTIQISWASTNTEVYEIDEADALGTNADGSTTWNMLYTGYPSQGTNTFWLDTGNYNLSPQILNPRLTPMRFYRIADLGPDSTSDEPHVSIGSPTNNTLVAGELTITVTAWTDQPVLAGTKLYVDGQEMPVSESTTNYTDATGVTNYEADTYTINSCEWLNGTHVLFATTECESGFGDVLGAGAIATGHAVSPLVPVVFNNLVEWVSLSQPSFDPSLGETQQVSAYFALNSDWRLNIVDEYSNVVQTSLGSGMTMNYNWDGTDNGTNIPNGIYYYYIYAATNGESSDVVSGGSGGGVGSPPSPDFMSSAFGGSDVSEWWVTDGSEGAVPLALYPPGFDTNGLSLFEASPADVRAALASSVSTRSLRVLGGGGATPDIGPGQPGYVTPLPNPQTTPTSPQRPPNNPIKGVVATFGVAYDTYSANGTNGVNCAILPDGLGAGGHISMQGNSASTALHWAPLTQYRTEANNFISQMQHWGWRNSLLKVDSQLSIGDLTGSGTPFNNVSLGLLLLHGTYGTTLDYTANGCKQMYFPIAPGGSAQYLRMSAMNLGGSGMNGLKWMAINACHSMYHVNWSSMRTAGIKPYNSNLHLLLGSDTDSFSSSQLMGFWAKYMNHGTAADNASPEPMTIRDAWYLAAREAFRNQAFPSGTTINFVVAGDSACQNDMIQSNSAPGGSWFIDTPVQVYP